MPTSQAETREGREGEARAVPSVRPTVCLSERICCRAPQLGGFATLRRVLVLFGGKREREEGGGQSVACDSGGECVFSARWVLNTTERTTMENGLPPHSLDLT